MAGSRDMTLQVIVRLRDELSRGLDGALVKINSWSQRAKGAFDRVAAGVGALSAKFGAFGLGAGLGMKASLDSFVRMDAVVRDIGITLGKSGRELERFTKDGIADLEKLAVATGQTSETLSDVWKEFAQAGGISEEQQKALRLPTGKATTAAGADPKDMAKVAVAMFNNADIRDQTMAELAFAHLIQGGKLGSVELKDMAQFLPEILAAQKNLGLSGMASIDTAVANLEISRKATGTPGEAATNYKDFLAGLNTAHTKKRFEEHGVDLPKVLADAAAKGINPIDAVMQKIAKIIDQPKVVEDALKRAKAKGLDPTKSEAEVRKAVDQAVKSAGLGELFVNQQTKMFAIARMLFLQDYKDMMKDLAATDGGVTDRDFDSRMASPEAKQRMAGERTEQLGRRFGSALSWVFDGASSIADAFRKVVDAADAISPKIVDLGTNIVALASIILTVVGALRWLGIGKKAVETAAAVGETVAEGGTAVAKTAVGAGGALAGVVANAVGSAVGSALGTAGGGSSAALDDLTTAARRAGEALGELAMRAAGAGAAAPGFAFQTGGGFGGEGYPPSEPGAAPRGFQTGGWFGGSASVPTPPPQKVDVGGSITVKVDGPGQITSTSSTNPAVPIGGDRGATVGRP